jgi:hypothetical protein
VASISLINGRLRRIARRAPRRDGILPDYLIVGAPRSGTTSVHGWLGNHPMVAATEKEILFFNAQWGRGVDWYRSRFPAAAERERFSQDHGRPFLTGDATASYLLHPWTPERAASVVPGAKVIVCLRDPVDRALSQFHAGRRRGYEPLETFEEALAAEPGRLEPEAVRVQDDPGYFSRPFHVWSYATGGRYAEQLERWLAHFPREAFLFASFERDIVADPETGLRRIQAHLGLDPQSEPELPTLNMNAGSYEGMAEETRARLVEDFRAQNRRLTELIGIDFGWAT